MSVRDGVAARISSTCTQDRNGCTMVKTERDVVTLSGVTLFRMIMFSIVCENAVSSFGKMVLNFIVLQVHVFPEASLHEYIQWERQCANITLQRLHIHLWVCVCVRARRRTCAWFIVNATETNV